MSSEVRIGAAVRALAHPPERAVAAVTLASALVLGGALLSQYVGGLEPCILCLYQRIPYAAAIALGTYALSIRGALGGAGMTASLFALSALLAADAGIALFHAGVEYKWWQGTAACGTRPLAGVSIEELRRALLERPVVRCDEPAFTLLGVSMAGYNFVAASALAAFALGAGWLGRAR